MGLENRIEPGPAHRGHGLEKQFHWRNAHAAHLMSGGAPEASQPARSLSATHSSSIMRRPREWEEREFRRAITDWEMARYFEIIERP